MSTGQHGRVPWDGQCKVNLPEFSRTDLLSLILNELYFSGVYPPYAEDTVVNAVHRSNSKNLIAYGDDFGVVKLFNYPCTDVMVDRRIHCIASAFID